MHEVVTLTGSFTVCDSSRMDTAGSPHGPCDTDDRGASSKNSTPDATSLNQHSSVAGPPLVGTTALALQQLPLTRASQLVWLRQQVALPALQPGGRTVDAQGLGPATPT